MYIISVLTCADKKVELTEAHNDELVARSQFLKTVAAISSSEDQYVMYEPVHKSLDVVCIYKKCIGHIWSNKDEYKIVTLHEMKQYEIAE